MHIKTTHLLRLTLSAAFAHACAFAGSKTEPSKPASGPASFADSNSLSEYFFGKTNLWDSTYDSVQKWKGDHHLPITIGAHHWWNIDRHQHVYGNGYGVGTERGTYYYFLDFDPKLKLEGDGFVKEIGIHFEGHLRDSTDKLRAFYRDTIWSYEAYAYAETNLGTFKAGQIVENFCIAWDNSWWEGVPYFDDYRFNPSYGVSWEKTWKPSNTFSIATSLQYFILSDRVSGAEPNASADTTTSVRLEEQNTGVVRLVPTWKLNSNTKIAFGVGGLVREIHGGSSLGLSSTQTAWDADVSVTWKNLSIYGQYIDSHGRITPSRYVSGGPSDRQDSVEVGINYKIGPVSAHVNYSKGWDHNPDGHQYIFNPGVTLQLTKNLTLYTEYVKWNVTNSRNVTSTYADGFELSLVWKF